MGTHKATISSVKLRMVNCLQLLVIFFSLLLLLLFHFHLRRLFFCCRFYNIFFLIWQFLVHYFNMLARETWPVFFCYIWSSACIWDVNDENNERRRKKIHKNKHWLQDMTEEFLHAAMHSVQYSLTDYIAYIHYCIYIYVSTRVE